MAKLMKMKLQWKNMDKMVLMRYYNIKHQWAKWLMPLPGAGSILQTIFFRIAGKPVARSHIFSSISSAVNENWEPDPDFFRLKPSLDQREYFLWFSSYWNLVFPVFQQTRNQIWTFLAYDHLQTKGQICYKCQPNQFSHFWVSRWHRHTHIQNTILLLCIRELIIILE